MNGVVTSEFYIACHGYPRDEVIEHADKISIEFLDSVGGAPWVLVDDDITRNHMPGYPLTDGMHGYAYALRRRYVFQGPVVHVDGMHHDGNHVQKGASFGE